MEEDVVRDGDVQNVAQVRKDGGVQLLLNYYLSDL